MCGIAGIYVKGDVGNLNLDAMLSTMLESIEHRGGHATGFVALTEKGVGRWQKAACGAREFNSERRPVPEDAVTILGHTRWATQGSPGFMENNHPIKRGPFFIIHNGHVHNDAEVFARAKRDRYGLVDSECIAASLSEQGDLSALDRVMEGLDGAAAVAAVDERRPRELALARGQSSPLFVLETRRLVMFGSTENSVVLTHRKHIGDVKAKAVTEVNEGTFIHLGRMKKPIVSKFHVPTYKKAWSWLKDDDDDLDKKTGKSSMPTVGGLSQNGQKVLSMLKYDIDYMECDVCATEYHADRLEYVVDQGERLLLCPTCYDWLNDPLEDDDKIDASPLDVRFRV